MLIVSTILSIVLVPVQASVSSWEIPIELGGIKSSHAGAPLVAAMEGAFGKNSATPVNGLVVVLTSLAS